MWPHGLACFDDAYWYRVATAHDWKRLESMDITWELMMSRTFYSNWRDAMFTSLISKNEIVADDKKDFDKSIFLWCQFYGFIRPILKKKRHVPSKRIEILVLFEIQKYFHESMLYLNVLNWWLSLTIICLISYIIIFVFSKL